MKDLIFESKLLYKLSEKFLNYIFNIENYFKDINHFEQISKYLTEEQKERVIKYPYYGENLFYYKEEEYLQKYPIQNDLYFLLQDLKILKNPYHLLSVNKYLDSAENKVKIMGLICGYWQNNTECSERVRYYNFIEEIIKAHIRGVNNFSFWNRIKLNEFFKVYLEIGKQGRVRKPIEIIKDSKIIDQVEYKSNKIKNMQKRTHKWVYKDWL